MGIMYLIIFGAYVIFAILTVSFVALGTYLSGRKKRGVVTLMVLFFLLFPTYDILIQKLAMTYYEKTQTLQEIKHTVEAPGSVYWEDNVWPGYDENYRLWMIDHLLDGAHIETLAMNGEDGKVYLYRYGQGDIPEVFEDASKLPPLNYKVELNPVKLPSLLERYIWSDQINIYDTRSGERIAFSRRYMGYSPRMYLVKVRGGLPFEGSGHIGEENVYFFDDKVVFSGITKKRQDEGYRSEFSKGRVSSSLRRFVEKRNLKEGM